MSTVFGVAYAGHADGWHARAWMLKLKLNIEATAGEDADGVYMEYDSCRFPRYNWSVWRIPKNRQTTFQIVAVNYNGSAREKEYSE
jgi:hypothetical protein